LEFKPPAEEPNERPILHPALKLRDATIVAMDVTGLLVRNPAL
jgi:hypothetical protein